MQQSPSLLTALFIVCYFMGNCPEQVISTTITRAKRDTFTALCKNCHTYRADCETSGVHVCKCQTYTTVFIRNKKNCESGAGLISNENCFQWVGVSHDALEVIDTEGDVEYYSHWRESAYTSCSVQPTIWYLDGKGSWQSFNMPAGVLESVDQQGTPSLKVVGNSPALMKYKGFLVKVDLRCKRRYVEGEDDRCLLFKAKGSLEFQLSNSSLSETSCKVSSSCFTPTISSGHAMPTSVNLGASSMYKSVWPTATTTNTLAASLTPSFQPNITANGGGDDQQGPNDIIVTLIVTIGVILCVLITSGAAWGIYRYKYRTRALDASNCDNSLRVVRNNLEQNYTSQEEPLYVELPDILPSETFKRAGNTLPNGSVEKNAVVCNPNVKEAFFSQSRHLSDPLPSRPPDEQHSKSYKGVDLTVNSHQNDAVDAILEDSSDSVVLTNPYAKDQTLTRSLSLERDTVNTCDGHHHVPNAIDEPMRRDTTEPVIYQGLDEGKRVQSIFVCCSCSNNPVYQRLSGFQSCGHETRDTAEGKRQSVYASLSHPLSLRDSVYAPLSLSGDDEGNEDEEPKEGDPSSDAAPVYHTLEPEDLAAPQATAVLDVPGSDEDLDEAEDDHEYRILEQDNEEGGEDGKSNCNELRDECLTNEGPRALFQPFDYLVLERAPSPMVPRVTRIKEPCVLRRRASSL